MKDLNEDYEKNIAHYSRLLDESEDSNHAGSWGGVNQDFRYRELTDAGLFKNATVLEIGCGTGGFLEYLKRNHMIQSGHYCGIDLVEKMQVINQKKFPDHRFLTRDILKQPFDEKFDVVVFCGVFNLKTPNGRAYMENLLRRGFSCCKKMMAFNFISTYVNYLDDAMEYHDPAEILEFCIRNFSTNVVMHHHYAKCDVSCKCYI